MLTRGHLEGGRGQNLQDVNELERRIGIEKERGRFSKNSVGGIKIACHLSTICNDNNDEKLNFENAESTLLQSRLMNRQVI